MAKPAAAAAAAAPADRTLELSGITGLPGMDSKRSAGPGTHSPKGRRYSQKVGRGPTGPPRTPELEEGPAKGLLPKRPMPKGAVLTAKKPSPSRTATAATPATATRDARAQQEKDQAAIRLQAARRGSVARRGSRAAAAAAAEARTAEAEAAATKMQAIRRGSGSRRQLQRQRQEKDQAAVKLQAVRRGSVARRGTAARAAHVSSVQGPSRIVEEPRPPPPPPQARPVTAGPLPQPPTRPVTEGRQLGEWVGGQQPPQPLAPFGGRGGVDAEARAAAEAYAGTSPVDNAWAAQELISRSAKFSSAFVRAHVQLEAQLLLALDGVQLAPSVCAAWSQPVQLYCAACVVDAYGALVREAVQVRTQSLECQPGQQSLSWRGVEMALGLPRRALAAPGAALQPNPKAQA